MPRRVMRLAVASVVSAGLVLSLWGAEPTEAEGWVRLDVDEYRIFSNAGEARTRQVALQLLQFREALALTTDLDLQVQGPIRIFVFRNGRDFDAVRKAMFDPRSAGKTGVFVGRGDGAYIAIDASAERRSYSLVFHELTHLYLSRSVPGAPLWYDEGMAEFYSTLTVSGDRATIGAPIIPHVRYLRRTARPLRLSRLLNLTSESPEYKSAFGHTPIYASSWILVHYLKSDPDRQKLLRAYVRKARTMPPDSAFREVFGMTAAEMEPQLRFHARRLFYPQQLVRVAVPEVGGIGELAPVPPDELLGELGHFLLSGHAGGRAMAQQLFATAVARNPGNAAAHTGLALLADLRRDYAVAARHYGEAIQMGAGSEAYLFAAESGLKGLFAGYPGGGAPADEVRRVRELFRAAAERSGEPYRSHSGLGRTYMFEESGPLQEGIEALEVAWSLERHPGTALNLAILRARIGEPADAERFVQEAKMIGADESMLAHARRAIDLAPLYRINTLLAAGREADALALVRAMQQEELIPSLRVALEGEAIRIEDQVCHNEQAEIYNLAVEFANGGDFETALRLLDTLPKSTVTAQVRDASDRLRRSIDTVRAQRQ
jgi:tetratricopeptide (TPR) repeat protein